MWERGGCSRCSGQDRTVARLGAISTGRRVKSAGRLFRSVDIKEGVWTDVFWVWFLDQSISSFDFVGIRRRSPEL